MITQISTDFDFIFLQNRSKVMNLSFECYIFVTSWQRLIKKKNTKGKMSGLYIGWTSRTNHNSK